LKWETEIQPELIEDFMEPEDSGPYSQELSICSYPEPDESSPCHPHPFYPGVLKPKLINSSKL
jgi:hypothetical protein